MLYLSGTGRAADLQKEEYALPLGTAALTAAVTNGQLYTPNNAFRNDGLTKELTQKTARFSNKNAQINGNLGRWGTNIHSSDI